MSESLGKRHTQTFVLSMAMDLQALLLHVLDMGTSNRCGESSSADACDSFLPLAGTCILGGKDEWATIRETALQQLDQIDNDER